MLSSVLFFQPFPLLISGMKIIFWETVQRPWKGDSAGISHTHQELLEVRSGGRETWTKKDRHLFTSHCH